MPLPVKLLARRGIDPGHVLLGMPPIIMAAKRTGVALPHAMGLPLASPL